MAIEQHLPGAPKTCSSSAAKPASIRIGGNPNKNTNMVTLVLQPLLSITTQEDRQLCTQKNLCKIKQRKSLDRNSPSRYATHHSTVTRPGAHHAYKENKTWGCCGLKPNRRGCGRSTRKIGREACAFISSKLQRHETGPLPLLRTPDAASQYSPLMHGFRVPTSQSSRCSWPVGRLDALDSPGTKLRAPGPLQYASRTLVP